MSYLRFSLIQLTCDTQSWTIVFMFFRAMTRYVLSSHAMPSTLKLRYVCCFTIWRLNSLYCLTQHLQQQDPHLHSLCLCYTDHCTVEDPRVLQSLPGENRPDGICSGNSHITKIKVQFGRQLKMTFSVDMNNSRITDSLLSL